MDGTTWPVEQRLITVVIATLQAASLAATLLISIFDLETPQLQAPPACTKQREHICSATIRS